MSNILETVHNIIKESGVTDDAGLAKIIEKREAFIEFVSEEATKTPESYTSDSESYNEGVQDGIKNGRIQLAREIAAKLGITR